ncbi:unnamed protein product [Spirodela intermedia]|uniref:Uncharacterized protein n=1 Tax=Spirodela intermedia TaxID=51605 RepID=A0A7I8J0D0_SPIIN|nr:unnamed protein product [Spirodela intermedia]CAA6663597.1 unnamed protein product [Spirodela intermedia]
MAFLSCGSSLVSHWGVRSQLMPMLLYPRAVDCYYCKAYLTSHHGLSVEATYLGSSSTSILGQSISFGLPNFRYSNVFHHRRGSGFLVRAEVDYYSALGVSKKASKSEIKTACYHPDVNPLDSGAEQKFKDISNAYEVLSDPEKRSLYDQYGEAGLRSSGMDMGDFGSAFDLFETLFEGMGGMGGTRGGRGGARKRPVRGEDEAYSLSLSFKEAVFGTCGACKGSGAKPGSKPKPCATCAGQGQVVSSVRTPLGIFQQVIACPACSGAGEAFVPCGTCGGDGLQRKAKRMGLKVPAGVDSGSRLRVQAEGNAGRRGGGRGDLYVFIEVIADPVLRREGTSVLHTCKVSYVDAILGTTVEVPTVDGPAELQVPAGTQPGATLVMSKKGVPFLRRPKARGDQLVLIQVEIPKRLTDEERSLVEGLAKLSKPVSAAAVAATGGRS